MSSKNSNKHRKYFKKGKTSKFRGVTKTSRGKFQCEISQRINGRRKKFYLGYFSDEEDAARCYDKASIKIGRKTFLNFPNEVESYELEEEMVNLHEKEERKRVNPELYSLKDRTSSRFFGVTRCKHLHRKKFMAQIRLPKSEGGKMKNLGYYEKEKDAAKAFDREAKRLGRRLNFPENCEKMMGEESKHQVCSLCTCIKFEQNLMVKLLWLGSSAKCRGCRNSKTPTGRFGC